MGTLVYALALICAWIFMAMLFPVINMIFGVKVKKNKRKKR